MAVFHFSRLQFRPDILEDIGLDFAAIAFNAAGAACGVIPIEDLSPIRSAVEDEFEVVEETLKELAEVRLDPVALDAYVRANLEQASNTIVLTDREPLAATHLAEALAEVARLLAGGRNVSKGRAAGA